MADLFEVAPWYGCGRAVLLMGIHEPCTPSQPGTACSLGNSPHPVVAFWEVLKGVAVGVGGADA